MKMIRQKLEEYLDGALTPAESAQLEQLMARDAKLAALLRSMRSERALRAAAYASFEPSASEAKAFAGKVMQAIAAEGDRPAGRIGYWVRRVSAVAAALAVVIGSFAVGRITAAKPVAQDTQTAQVIYRVMYTGQDGESEMREFASIDDANTFSKQMDVKHADPVMISANSSDDFDADRPGSL